MAVLSAPKTRTSYVELVAKVRSKGGDEGFVDRRGVARIRRGGGKVDVFFPDKVTRGTTTYRRRLFMAPFLSVLEKQDAVRARVAN